MDRGKQAIRGNMRVSFDDSLFEEPELEEEQQLREDEDALIATYASLQDHPGWELIKKDFVHTIEAYRSGRAIKTAIETKSLEELGRLTITSNAVADELEKIILTVETAVAQVEEKIKDGRRKK